MVRLLDRVTQRRRVAQTAGRELRLAGVERLPALRARALEPGRLDRLGGDGQRVVAVPQLDRAGVARGLRNCET